MELQTASQVSQDYGVSTRMLRYYEQIGLIESSRKDDYAYRVYDGAATKRLQQIIILRKLQIPVKQISDILKNQDAVAVIEIFKRNISELDEKITALSTVKSILTRFVDDMQEKADVHLKLDLLNDKTMLAVMGSFSFPKNKIEEKMSMNELNRAAESLDKVKERFVRVVKLPPATMARVFCEVEKDNPDNPYEVYGIAKNIMGEFIKDVDLLKIKPDFRLFQSGNVAITTCEIRVTIPDDLPVPAPLAKIHHPGGLYAAYLNTPEDNVEWKIVEAWAENSEDYEWRAGEARFEEHLNKYNIYGLKNADLEYWDFFLPIKEIEEITEEQIEKLNTAEKCFSQCKSTEIDLTAMVKSGESDLSYKNGLMEMKVDGDCNGMGTPQQFKTPLKIAARLKTDGNDFRIRYAKGEAAFNWEHIRSTMIVSDITDGKYHFYKKRGIVQADEFVDIEWILGRDVMAVRVNGEIRCISDDYGYIRTFKKNPELSMSSPVIITGAFGSTVTVERLRITEI